MFLWFRSPYLGHRAILVLGTNLQDGLTPWWDTNGLLEFWSSATSLFPFLTSNPDLWVLLIKELLPTLVLALKDTCFFVGECFLFSSSLFLSTFWANSYSPSKIQSWPFLMLLFPLPSASVPCTLPRCCSLHVAICFCVPFEDRHCVPLTFLS